jgi:hypothetical protein
MDSRTFILGGPVRPPNITTEAAGTAERVARSSCHVVQHFRELYSSSTEGNG